MSVGEHNIFKAPLTLRSLFQMGSISEFDHLPRISILVKFAQCAASNSHWMISVPEQFFVQSNDSGSMTEQDDPLVLALEFTFHFWNQVVQKSSRTVEELLDIFTFTRGVVHGRPSLRINLIKVFLQ